MRAFFHRLQRGAGAKDKDRDVPTSPKEKFPPLPSWPPTQESHRPTSTATTPSMASFKPLPELVPIQLTSQLTSRPPIETMSTSQVDLQSVTSRTSVKATTAALPAEEHSQESSTTNTSESVGRPSRKNNGSASTPPNDVQKKVAFISPPQSPVDFDRALPDAPTGNITPTPASAPLKTTVSRFQAVYGKEPRVPVSTGPSASKTDVASTNKTSINPAASTRTISPYLQKFPEGGSTQSLRSGTPYSQTSVNTSGSRILAAQSWSEVTEGDLVSNLGSRERTRQEVLFEIISSEERCEATFTFGFFFLLSFTLQKIRSRTCQNERHFH